MTEQADRVDLADAIEALRDALARAMKDGRDNTVRFRVEPIELTVHVGVTRKGSGIAGVKWHILTLGGERSHMAETTQTLRMRLVPVFFDEKGNEIPSDEELITDRITSKSRAENGRAFPDPA